MKRLTLLLILFQLGTFALSQSPLILLQPTAEEVDSLVEMEVINQGSPIAERIYQIVDSSVISEFLSLHELLQIYLFNTRGKAMEPAYLALTQNQGGLAKQGFVLKNGDEHIKKDQSFYVDIIESVGEKDYASLMSITQLYPHELGHIFYRLLSSNDTIEESSKNLNIHFFSMMTDYQIAFNEGFAEHMENIARKYERNPKIIEGIQADTTRIVQQAQKAIRGFTRDFKLPFRVGFYKMSMLAWYQPFEDYKRFAYAYDGRSKYYNQTIHTGNRQNNLIYRNASVGISDQLRNQVQTLATEGVISAFFSTLMETDLKNRYQSKAFYYPFLKDTTSFNSPEQLFSPLQNQFLKYFHVLDRYVTLEHSDKAQLIDFIDGYLETFPEESATVKSIYQQATGMEYENSLPPQIWLLVKDQSHGILALDAYAGLSVPFYTFELNMAGLEDLMMIETLTQEDAQTILQHRSENGLFTRLEQINDIPNLSKQAKEALRAAAFDQEYFNQLEFSEDLNIQTVIAAPLKSLAKYSLLYFVVLMLLYFSVLRRERQSILKYLAIISKFLLLWLILILIGLIIAATASNWIFVLILPILISMLVFFSKNSQSVKRVNWTIILFMTGIITLSIL